MKYKLIHENADSITIINGDTLIIKNLKEVMYFKPLKWNEIKDKSKYYFLRKKVHKVYYFAKMASDSLMQLQARIDMQKRRKNKRREVKKVQKFIQKELKPILKKLTKTDGRVLSKLVHRETGFTVYKILKTYKSGWSAFWWNAKANLFSISLKKEYDPLRDEEDRMIEDILVKAFANGTLSDKKATTFLNNNIRDNNLK